MHPFFLNCVIILPGPLLSYTEFSHLIVSIWMRMTYFTFIQNFVLISWNKESFDFSLKQRNAKLETLVCFNQLPKFDWWESPMEVNIARNFAFSYWYSESPRKRSINLCFLKESHLTLLSNLYAKYRSRTLVLKIFVACNYYPLAATLKYDHMYHNETADFTKILGWPYQLKK